MSDVLTFPEDRRPVSMLGVDTRAAFIGRTYSWLFGAIVAFVLAELVLFRTGVPETMIGFLQGGGSRWLLFLGAFMVVGWLASRTAMRTESIAAQYAALFVYVVAEALLFAPLLWIADRFAPGVITSAALVTLVGSAGLTAVVFTTRKDFSFLGSIVRYGMVIALVLILAGTLFGFNLGTFFSVAMIGLAGAAILHDTSNILHHYPEDKHVAAALGLFASIALMFWYVLQLMMALRD